MSSRQVASDNLVIFVEKNEQWMKNELDAMPIATADSNPRIKI